MPRILLHEFICLFIAALQTFDNSSSRSDAFVCRKTKPSGKNSLVPSSTKHTHTRSQGSHQLIQSSVSHCYTHGQQKATRILINNVIHPGLRALNPGILAACFFSLSLFLEIPGKMLRAFFYTVELMQLDLMHTARN